MGAKKSKTAAAANPLLQLQAARNISEAISGQLKGHVSHTYLIRIREQKNRERAIMAFLGVREGRVTLPGDIMGVSADHIEALKREGIPFTYVSKSPHGQ